MNKPLEKQLKRVLSEGLHGFSEIGYAKHIFDIKSYKGILKPLDNRHYIEFDDISKKALIRLLGLYVIMNIISLVITVMVSILSFTSILTSIVSLVWIVFVACSIAIAFGIMENRYKIVEIGKYIWVFVEVVSILMVIGCILDIFGRISAFMLIHSSIIVIRIIINLVYILLYAAIAGVMLKCKVSKREDVQ